VTMGADADIHWYNLATTTLNDLNLILATLRVVRVRTKAGFLARLRGRGQEASVAGVIVEPARSRADQAVADAAILVHALAAQTAIAAAATRAMRGGGFMLRAPITLTQVLRRLWFNAGVFQTCADERESLSPEAILAAYARYELLRRGSLLSGPELVRELRNGIDSRVDGVYELCDETNTPDGQVWKSIKHCRSGAKVLPPPSTHTPQFFAYIQQSGNACFRSRSQSSQPCIGYHSSVLSDR
jgi:hypothetical protein